MSNVADPNVQGSQEQETEKPQALTQDDVVKVVNSAITSHLKRLDLNKQITSALETHLTPFKEFLSGSKSQEEKVEQTKSSDKSSASPELIAMQKKMENMEKMFKSREEAISLKEKAALEKEAFSRVKSELVSFPGLRAEAVDAVAKLMKSDGKIHIDENGDVSYLDDDGESVLDLKSGLKKYLDPKLNPAAGLYLAPKTALGKKASNLPGRNGSALTIDKNLSPAQKTALMLENMGLKV